MSTVSSAEQRHTVAVLVDLCCAAEERYHEAE